MDKYNQIPGKILVYTRISQSNVVALYDYASGTLDDIFDFGNYCASFVYRKNKKENEAMAKNISIEFRILENFKKQIDINLVKPFNIIIYAFEQSVEALYDFMNKVNININIIKIDFSMESVV